MKIGVICPSEIALRRFMPSISLIDDIEFIGIGVCSEEERFGDNKPSQNVVDEILGLEREKANAFIEQYGGKIFDSYQSIVESDEIEAIYIPLPPALHFKWAKMSLECGKHVLVEKPSTICTGDTKILTELAASKRLALHENYMFAFHKQLEDINDIVESGELGDVRLYRLQFGFPMRQANDFRYNKALGGGALIDACGYTIKYSTMLLGDSARIAYAQMNYLDGFEVDMYGSAAMVNDEGTVVQLAYGMDNSYKCELEVWGSKGYLTTGRVLTAPAGFAPSVKIIKGSEVETRELSADDAFKKSVEYFMKCVTDDMVREANYTSLVKQAELVDEFRKMANVESRE